MEFDTNDASDHNAIIAYQVLTAICVLGLVFVLIILYYVIKVSKGIFNEPGFVMMLTFLMICLISNIAFY
jgi:hypothetical protein